MKSLSTSFMFCYALILALSVNAHGDDWPVGKGDVTGDGIIDGRDALVILQHLEGIITLTPEQIERGDVYPNPGTGGRQAGDGTLTREDTQTILDYTVGLTPLGDLTGDYSHSQPFIEAITPISGKVGDEVTLVGRNFPSGNIANAEIYLGETRAEIVSITGSMITIIVPEGASSGRFRLNTLGGATFSHTTYSVLDIIDVVLEVDSGLDIRNFLVFSSHDFHECDSTTDRFSLFGPKDEITLYQAATFNDDNPNLYQYFYIPGYSPLGALIRINALSTAKAMLFTAPFIATKDAVRAATLFRLMEDLPETHELADAISKKFPQGTNVFEDEEFILLLDSAVDALFDAIFADIDANESSLAALRDDQTIQAKIAPSASSPSPPIISIKPANISSVDAPVMIRRYDMDYLQAAYRKSDHSVVVGLGEAIFDQHTNEVSDISDGYSPVDWVVTMYELDPDDFPLALSMSAAAMQTKGFTNSLSKQTIALPANLWTAKIDILYALTDMFVGKTLDFIEFDEMIDELIFTDRTYSFRLSQEGLYIIHGYSGVQYVWRDEELKDFAAILAIEDGIQKMSIALASDIVHMIIDFTDLGTNKPQRFLRALSKKVAKNVIRSISQDLPPAYETWGDLSYNERFDIIFGILVEGLKAALTAAPHYALIYMQENINPVTAMKLGLVQEKADGSLKSRLLTSLKPGKILAILDKTSSVGRIAERFAGLFGRIINVLGLEMSLGPTPLESAIVVVGDPFSPHIHSFSPMAGSPGDLVVLHGKRFAAELEDNEVWFGNIKVEVVAIEGREKLTVRVPMYQSNFQPYEEFTIRIETPGMMKPGYSKQDFYLYRIPILDRVEPYRTFSSVPSDSQSLFAGYRTEINIHGWQLFSKIGIWDKVFIGAHVLEMSQFNLPPSLRAFLPDNLEPGIHELYIVSPENGDYVTPSIPIEIIGPPEVYRLDRDSARVGERVLIHGMFLGDPYYYRVTVGERTVGWTRKLSGGEMLFEMPTIGEPGEHLEVRVHSPSGISEALSIQRDPGFADLTQPEMPTREAVNLPKGWTIYVDSPSSGFDSSTNFLTLDEAVAIASGAVDPYSPPWDDQDEEWFHHFIQKKIRLYDREREEYYDTYEWHEDKNRLQKVYLPGGPGDEYRTRFRIDHYHPDNKDGMVTDPYQIDHVNLDDEDANKEKGDFVIGDRDRGGPGYANTIVIRGGGTFYAENSTLPILTTIEMENANLVLSGNGLQFSNNCVVKVNNITVAGGAGVAISGSGNRLTANSLNSVHDGIVIQSGNENSINLKSLKSAENGFMINGGFKNYVFISSIDSGLSGVVLKNSVDNYLNPNMITAGEYGVYIEGGGWNQIESQTSIQNAEQAGFMVKSSHGNQAQRLSIQQCGDGVMLIESIDNDISGTITDINEIGMYMEGGGKHRLSAHIKGCGSSGIVLKNSHENNFWTLAINPLIADVQGHGVHLIGSHENHLELPIMNAKQNGIFLENSSLNTIDRFIRIEGCGEHGIHLKHSHRNSIAGHISSCDGDGLVLEDSGMNRINRLNVLGNRSGVVMSGNDSNHNESQTVFIGAASILHTHSIVSLSANSEYGLHLRNGAHSNTFADVNILLSGDHSLLIEDIGTSNNSFDQCTIGAYYGFAAQAYIPEDLEWPSRSGASGLVLRRGAGLNRFNYVSVNHQSEHGIVVQDANTDFNTFSNVVIGMCKISEAQNRELYQNSGWGVVVEEGPQNLRFEQVVTGFNLLGGFFVDQNRIDEDVDVHNIVFHQCSAGYLENDHNSQRNARIDGLNGGAGFRLQDSSNVYLSFCRANQYDYGLWIHGAESNNNDVWSGEFIESKHTSLLIESSKGDRIRSTSIAFHNHEQDPDQIGYHLKNTVDTHLDTILFNWNVQGVVLRIEDCQSILVENSGFHSSTRKNLIEILNSSEVRLNRLRVNFAGQNGIWIAQHSNNIVLDRCDISENGENGVHILDSNNIYILHRYSQYNKQDGVRVENAENVNLHDVFLANNQGNGLSILDAFTQDVCVIGCRFSGNENGVFASAGAGIEIGTAQPREEDVNYFISHDNAGVYLSGVSTHAVIYNNVFGIPYFDTANPHQFGNNHGIILSDHIRDVIIDSNHIVHSKGNGVLIQDGASNNKVMRNILHDNQLHGVLVQGSSTLGNVISHNSITGNQGQGIALSNGGNSMQKGPDVDTVTWRGESIRGEANAPDGSVVEVYYDHADQGLHIAGIGNVFRGRFDISGNYDPTMRLNAIVITPNGDTSEFTPVELNPDAVDHFFFTGEQGGNRDIYYQGKPNTPPRRITHHSAADYSPHALKNGDGVLFVTERDGNPDIWFYQTRKREFFTLTSESSAEIDPCVEPDAKSFLFAADYAGSMNIYRLPFTSSSAPGSVSYDKGPIDGGRVRSAGYTHGMLINSPPDSSVESVSIYIQNNPAPFAWSLHDWVNNEPERTALLEGTASPDSTGWHRIDLEGFAVPSRFVIVITMLESGAPILGHAESSPRRGYWLAFENTWEWVNAENLMIRVQFEIDPPQRLTNNNGENRFPAASPDGGEIAFCSFQNNSWNIWIMNRDGSNPRQITSGNSNNTKPVWSSNGQSVLFVSDRNGHPDVYQISKDGANLHRLTEYQGQDIDPVWSLDGERVLFCSDRSTGLEIYRMVNNDIYTDRLTFVTGNASQPHAAPFISSLVYGQRTPQTELSAYTDSINKRAVGLAIDLEPAPPIAKPGDTVEVAIHASNADHLANLALDLRYDPSVLRLISLQPSDSFTRDSMQSLNPLSPPSSDGWMRWNWIQPIGLLGDIQVAQVLLEILPEVDDRQTLVYLASSSAFNSSLQAIELATSDTRINIDNGHTSIDHWMLFD